jgi:hypothetical protein
MTPKKQKYLHFWSHGPCNFLHGPGLLLPFITKAGICRLFFSVLNYCQKKSLQIFAGYFLEVYIFLFKKLGKCVFVTPTCELCSFYDFLPL